ncbi:cell division protein FtsL [Amylibacter marinus]|uniref:Cell division protein FtsL n=1 Tax=Amylibacter marinus TaxID=1475483 RepID=A0ABQ5VUR6_9RHOB|nr:cell division protein FtsL [Amylibacter marinus]GLQ34879.1 cell division protein FtsL [Amylibacter marinus]
MRVFLYLSCLGLVVFVAYWAYTENYTTQASSRRVDNLHQQIAQEREALSVLNAEWAYLNRPDRLRDLVEMNFDSLGLVPLAAQHFAELEDIPLPPAALGIPNLPVSVKSVTPVAEEGKDFP